MKTRLLALLMAVAMLFSFAACAKTEGKTDEGADAGTGTNVEAPTTGVPEDFTIAYAAVTTSLAPYVIAIANEMQKMADNNGWNLVMYDGMGDVTTQTEQVASIISDDEADLVILFPVDSEVGVTFVEQFADAGMPVITVSSDVTEAGQDKVICFVGPDQNQLVKYGADYVKETFGTDAELNYVVLSGWQAQYDYKVREAAVNTYFADAANYKQLAVKYCGASRDTAFEEMSALLSAYDDIDFVFALSDEFALGAIQAIEDAGRTGEVKVISLEAFQEGLDAIKAGKLDLTVTQTGYNLVGKLEEVIKAYYAGEKLDYVQLSPVERVTAENVDTVKVEY